MIREVLEVSNVVTVPRIMPGGYEWTPLHEVCENGVAGYLDGFWIRFSKWRIGFVRGLYLFIDCKPMLSQAEYESMEDLEEKKFDKLLVKKIPYRLATSMLNTSKAERCGYIVKELYSPHSWETPLWKKFTIDLKLLYGRFIFNAQQRSKGLGGN